jgi:ring-1,2-phenylacetyl-CoA epoxidase subunit PaaD
MVSAMETNERAKLYALLSDVCDPEIPVLTLEDLGVLRDITVADGRVTVTITPTYNGCPALHTMRADIEEKLAAAGYRNVQIEQRLSPAWTTDWMSEAGRKKLRDYGIAPPAGRGQTGQHVQCPQCGSDRVKRISEFGSTACKAMYRCEDCREPFDYFKCI